MTQRVKVLRSSRLRSNVITVYHQSFQLRPVTTWMNPSSSASWKNLEEALIHPIRLQDLLFSNISNTKCLLNFGPIIAYTITNFRVVEKRTKCTLKGHVHTPLWHNIDIKSGSKPFESKQWALKGINTLGDVYDSDGLRSFQDLCLMFDIPGTSFFLYLRL